MKSTPKYGRVTSIPFYVQKYKVEPLVFADDLTLFCKGDIKSISRMIQVLQHFSRVTGLEADLNKSNVFMEGVEDDIRTRYYNSLCQSDI